MLGVLSEPSTPKGEVHPCCQERLLGLAQPLRPAGLGSVVQPRKAEQAETQRLRRENKRLEEEVEILKKAAAFFARGIA